MVIQNHGNNTSSGTDEEFFNITAPAAHGTYDLTLIAYSNDACSTLASAPFTLTDAITVGIFGDSFGVAAGNA